MALKTAAMMPTRDPEWLVEPEALAERIERRWLSTSPGLTETDADRAERPRRAVGCSFHRPLAGSFWGLGPVFVWWSGLVLVCCGLL
jgi:hypothetical protein